jgi:dTDP-glucose 4,6-dehydratase
MSKSILVTGGAGFIGSNFVRHMLDKYPEYRILVLDNLTYAGDVARFPAAALQHQEDRFRFWYGNVGNQDLVTMLVKEANVVVHFAAETHVTRSIFDNQLFFLTDVLGTQTLANSIVQNGGVDLFIHISTSEVYGTAIDEAMSEDHPLNPTSPYASAKCGADRLVYSYRQTYRLPSVIVRPFNQYGPLQHLEKVVPRFVTSVLLGEDLTVHGKGDASRDFLHVEDTIAALDTIIHAPPEKVLGETFNIASGTHRDVLSIAHDITDRMGYPRKRITFVGERPGQVERHTGDWSKINRTLGWRPTVSWEDGLQRTIDWFKANPAAWQHQTWMRYIPIITAAGKVEMH